jgi:WD40 repeat protein
VRDSHTGQLIEPRLHHQSIVRAAVYSRDGRIIATVGSNDQTARLWDAATHQPIGEPIKHQGQIGAIAISPDGKLLLTGTDTKVAQLWEIASGRPIGSPFEHAGTVRSVSFSPDGRMIATGSWDRTARLWDPRTGKSIGPPLRHDGEVEVVIFTPDGRRLLTGSWDKTARFWPVPTPIEGSLDQIRSWVAVLTGMELDANDAVRMLDAETWHERQRAITIDPFMP